jgi:hypothetical protein
MPTVHLDWAETLSLLCMEALYFSTLNCCTLKNNESVNLKDSHNRLNTYLVRIFENYIYLWWLLKHSWVNKMLKSLCFTKVIPK